MTKSKFDWKKCLFIYDFDFSVWSPLFPFIGFYQVTCPFCRQIQLHCSLGFACIWHGSIAQTLAVCNMSFSCLFHWNLIVWFIVKVHWNTIMMEEISSPAEKIFKGWLGGSKRFGITFMGGGHHPWWVLSVYSERSSIYENQTHSVINATHLKHAITKQQASWNKNCKIYTKMRHWGGLGDAKSEASGVYLRYRVLQQSISMKVESRYRKACPGFNQTLFWAFGGSVQSGGFTTTRKSSSLPTLKIGIWVSGSRYQWV